MLLLSNFPTQAYRLKTYFMNHLVKHDYAETFGVNVEWSKIDSGKVHLHHKAVSFLGATIMSQVSYLMENHELVFQTC